MRPELRAQDEFARETTRFESAMRLGDLVERDSLGDTRPDGACANMVKRCSRSSRNQVGWCARIRLID